MDLLTVVMHELGHVLGYANGGTGSCPRPRRGRAAAPGGAVGPAGDVAGERTSVRARALPRDGRRRGESDAGSSPTIGARTPRPRDRRAGRPGRSRGRCGGGRRRPAVAGFAPRSRSSVAPGRPGSRRDGNRNRRPWGRGPWWSAPTTGPWCRVRRRSRSSRRRPTGRAGRPTRTGRSNRQPPSVRMCRSWRPAPTSGKNHRRPVGGSPRTKRNRRPTDVSVGSAGSGRGGGNPFCRTMFEGLGASTSSSEPPSMPGRRSRPSNSCRSNRASAINGSRGSL